MTIELALGTVLRRLRMERQLSQKALSARSKLDRVYISQIECGRKNPTLVSICTFAAGLNVPPHQIFHELETLIANTGQRVDGRKNSTRHSHPFNFPTADLGFSI